MADAPRRPRRRRRGLLAGLAFVGLFGLVWVFLDPFAPALPPGHDPEAFRALVEIGRSIQGQERANSADLDRLKSFVDDHREQAEASREWLSRRPSATLVPTSDGQERHFAELGAFRSIGRLWLARAKVHEADGQLDDAAAACLDALELARVLDRNGLIADRLAAVAVERQALAQLSRLAEVVPPAILKRVATRLDEIERDRSPLETITRRDLRYTSRRNGPMARLVMHMNPGAFQGPLQVSLRAAESADREVRSEFDRLRNDLARRH